MKTIIVLLLLFLLFSQSLGEAQAADFSSEVIYQVVVDRFANGRSDNDDPPQSKGMFDPTFKNWRAYWGGDLCGLTGKLDYIKSLGATAIWISPVLDNINRPLNDETGAMVAPYHGYYTRDFMKLEEHFSDKDNSYKDFDKLISEAHARGLKIIVDLPINHTSPYNHGEYGALYDSGQFRSDVENDRNKYFHHLPLISDYSDPFQVQYGTLAYLGDLDQENQYVSVYLNNAVAKLAARGVDGFRIDAARHANWGFQKCLAACLYDRGDLLLSGEWWLTGIDDPLFHDAVDFANKGGISLFDFPFALSLRKCFIENGDFAGLARTIEREDSEFSNSGNQLTFLDNHDLPRFLSKRNSLPSFNQAMAVLLLSRGLPVIYYGAEQGLHNDTKGGEDPFDRPWMNSFDTKSMPFLFAKDLLALRRAHQALCRGKQETVFVDQNIYVFARKCENENILVAVNKGQAKEIALPGKDLPASGAADLLGGKMGGCSFASEKLSLPAESVSVWSVSNHASNEPRIFSVRPPVVLGGKQSTIYGEGFNDALKVFVGGEAVNSSARSDSISFRAPLSKHGRLAVEVEFGGKRKIAGELIVLEKKPIPLRLVLSGNIPPSSQGQVFVSGDVFALGEGRGEEAAGPMLASDDTLILCVPLPSGREVSYKLLLRKDGKTVKEGRTLKLKVPDLGPAQAPVFWQ